MKTTPKTIIAVRSGVVFCYAYNFYRKYFNCGCYATLRHFWTHRSNKNETKILKPITMAVYQAFPSFRNVFMHNRIIQKMSKNRRKRTIKDLFVVTRKPGLWSKNPQTGTKRLHANKTQKEEVIRQKQPKKSRNERPEKQKPR